MVHFCYVIDQATFYFKSGNAWVSIDLTGPQGVQGDMGPTGPKGPQGAPGARRAATQEAPAEQCGANTWSANRQGCRFRHGSGSEGADTKSATADQVLSREK
jgi:hypothetical protein